MDFNIVKCQIIYEYLSIYGSDRKDSNWSLKDVINIFRYFYRKYEEVIGEDHPFLTSESINKIILRLPYLEYDEPLEDIELLPEHYQALIDSYFEQDFDYGNYSIAHFMSGKIRALRFFETMY